MISKEEVMPLLIETCPSFREVWIAYQLDWDGEKPGLYNEFGEFARYLVQLLISNQTAEFPLIFELIERLLIEGDKYVSDAIIVGLLEDIQNRALSQNIDLNNFVKYLGPESIKGWNNLVSFWNSDMS